MPSFNKCSCSVGDMAHTVNIAPDKVVCFRQVFFLVPHEYMYIFCGTH